MKKSKGSTTVDPKLFLKKLMFTYRVLEGVIPSRAYGEGPHAQKYARQLERIHEAQMALCELMSHVEPV